MILSFLIKGKFIHPGINNYFAKSHSPDLEKIKFYQAGNELVYCLIVEYYR